MRAGARACNQTAYLESTWLKTPLELRPQLPQEGELGWPEAHAPIGCSRLQLVALNDSIWRLASGENICPSPGNSLFLNRHSEPSAWG